MVMESFNHLSRKDKYAWDVRRLAFQGSFWFLIVGTDVWSRECWVSQTNSTQVTPFQAGDEPEIPLVKIGDSVEEVSERWAIVQKMEYTTQYTYSGDSTG
jgi:hypothetical protein